MTGSTLRRLPLGWAGVMGGSTTSFSPCSGVAQAAYSRRPSIGRLWSRLFTCIGCTPQANQFQNSAGKQAGGSFWHLLVCADSEKSAGLNLVCANDVTQQATRLPIRQLDPQDADGSAAAESDPASTNHAGRVVHEDGLLLDTLFRKTVRTDLVYIGLFQSLP